MLLFETLYLERYIFSNGVSRTYTVSRKKRIRLTSLLEADIDTLIVVVDPSKGIPSVALDGEWILPGVGC